MISEKVISDEVLEMVQLAIDRNENWMTYNNSLYFVDKEDIRFFKDRYTAAEFIEDNISNYDRHSLIYVQSLSDVFRHIPYGVLLENQLNNSSIKNVSIMNEQNFEYLKDNIKYMGFGEKQNESLEQHLRAGKEAFQLNFNAEINQKAFMAILNFRKSDSTDMYFFNSYNASLERKTGEKVDQTFYLNKGKGVTSKEAFNLLDGRAVFKELTNKEGQTYNAWVQLDFDKKDRHNNHEVKQFHENYGFDLKAAASKFAISELADPEKEKALMQSLQKGNIQSISIEKEGNISKMYIEANPQFKNVSLYDAQMKRVQKENLGQYYLVQQSSEKKAKPEKKEDVKQNKKKEIKQNTEEHLGTQKIRSSRKNGMSV